MKFSSNGPDKVFIFKTELSLVFLTGLKAANVRQLRDHLKQVPESSVYYHTHNFLQRHHFLIAEPPNDFAYWVTSVLKEEKLGERLTAIDTVAFNSLESLKDELLKAMDSFLATEPALREAPMGSEFNFLKVMTFDFPIECRAVDLASFVDSLKKVSVHSLYYHMFEGRLRTSRGANDFSIWLAELGETELSRQIGRLDPYSHTLEELRSRIIRLVEKKLMGVHP